MARRASRAPASAPMASSEVSVCAASSRARAYSAVWNSPGMMMGCQYRSVSASCSASSQSSNHAGTGPSARRASPASLPTSPDGPPANSSASSASASSGAGGRSPVSALAMAVRS